MSLVPRLPLERARLRTAAFVATTPPGAGSRECMGAVGCDIHSTIAAWPETRTLKRASKAEMRVSMTLPFVAAALYCCRSPPVWKLGPSGLRPRKRRLPRPR
jgi:hypothetical protein